MTWDLSIFYKSFDDPQIREDINEIKAMLSSVEALMTKEESAAEKLEAIISFEEKIGTLLNRIMMFGHLTLAADNTNADALRLMDEMGMLMVDVKLADSRFGRYVGSIENLDEVIASSERLTQNGFYLREEAEHAHHMVPAEMEKSLLRMSLNGGDACRVFEAQRFARQYSVLQATPYIDSFVIPLYFKYVYHNHRRFSHLLKEIVPKAFSNVRGKLFRRAKFQTVIFHCFLGYPRQFLQGTAFLRRDNAD